MIIDFLINKTRLLRARSRHKTLRLKIARMSEFLCALNRSGIPYVILRWHDRVPLTQNGSRHDADDVDFLIDESFQDLLVSIASRFRGDVKCDFYGVGAQRGFAFNRLPYYPPALAALVLRDRVFCVRRGFYVPAERHHLFTFLYHLVYHKGAKSGIPMYEADGSPGIASRPNPYMQEAERIARAYDPDLTLPCTLERLYEFLVNAGWQMPLDLLMRWKVKDEFHQRIIARELGDLTEWSQRLPELVVFVIRGDAAEEDIFHATLKELETEYSCLASFVLTDQQIHSLTVHTRGGNWVEGRRNAPVLPYAVVLCVPRPCRPSETRRRVQFGASLKEQIRRKINKRFSRGGKLFVVHSTDDANEAQYYLHVLYGEDRTSQCERIENLLKDTRKRVGGVPSLENKTARGTVTSGKAEGLPAMCWESAQ